MALIVSVRQLTKTFSSGFQALKSVSLDIAEGEIELNAGRATAKVKVANAAEYEALMDRPAYEAFLATQ
jgi:ABC-type branched-subunit amino acid transport system ATPase component